MFENKFGGVRIIIDCQSGWRPNEDMKMSHPVSLGQLRIIISPFWTCITATKCQKTKNDFTAKHGMGCSEIRA